MSAHSLALERIQDLLGKTQICHLSPLQSFQHQIVRVATSLHGHPLRTFSERSSLTSKQAWPSSF